MDSLSEWMAGLVAEVEAGRAKKAQTQGGDD